ncbi:MAG: hypothetical protein LH466_02205 [Sphingomonas bacterium]|nr:hypothetical protein [Sphingomonas bacterium]
MTKPARRGKLYPFFTIMRDTASSGAGPVGKRWDFDMVALSATLFMALFGFGASYFGWADPEGKVRLALFATFTLGIISGYKLRS